MVEINSQCCHQSSWRRLFFWSHSCQRLFLQLWWMLTHNVAAKVIGEGSFCSCGGCQLTVLQPNALSFFQLCWWWWLLAFIQRYSPLSSRLTALACESTWVTCLFYSAFFNIHWSGVLTALAWLMPHESAAVSARSVYTIQPCTMSLHAKPHT